jgi:hypothetical protein
MKLIPDSLLTPIPPASIEIQKMIVDAEEDRIPDQPIQEIPNPGIISYEGLNGSSNDCVPIIMGFNKPKPKRTQYIKKQISVDSDSYIWEFFLNVDYVNTEMMNNFMHIMGRVKENDKILIHCPCAMSTDKVEMLISILQASACKSIEFSAPFILSIEVAYLILFGTSIRISPYMFMFLPAPALISGGKPQDLKSNLTYEVNRMKKMLRTLVTKKIIDSVQYNHIIEEQGSVALYGETLMKNLRALYTKPI